MQILSPKYRWAVAVVLLSLVSLLGCKPPNGGRAAEIIEVTPDFMYANDDGQIRLVELDISGADTTYNISSFTTLRETDEFGVIQTDRSFYYDMAPMDTSQSPRFSAYLRRDNPAWRESYGPTSSYYSKIAYISDSKRTNNLNFYSQLDDQLKTIEYERTVYYSESKTSHFVDRNTLIALWIDANEEYETPSNLHTSALLLRFSLNSTNPTQAEVITTFRHGNKSGLPSPYIISKPQNAKVNSSANGEFFILWSDTYVFGHIQPFYYIRKDGTAALNSMEEIGKDYRTNPGYLIHGLDPHPTKDSIVVVADISDPYSNGLNNNAIHVMHLPDSPKNWLRPIHTLSWSRVIGVQMLDWRLTHNKDNLFLQYSPQGDKIAIAHALPGRNAEVVIWQPETDLTKTFTFPSGSNIDKISKPAWHPTDNRFLYITAANTASADTSAHIYMLDTDKQEGTLKRINWNSQFVKRLNISEDESLREVKPLISRRPNQ